MIRRLHYEAKLFRQLGEIKNLRHSGRFKDKETMALNKDSDIYDWIVDIDLITKMATEGWEVNFSKSFLDKSSADEQQQIMGMRLD